MKNFDIDKLKIKDAHAWESFLNECARLVHREVYRWKGTESDFEEIMSELEAKVWKYLRSRPPDSWKNFGGWVWEITNNATNDYFKHKKRDEKRFIQFEDAQIINSEDEEDKFIQQEQKARVWKAIKYLEPRKQNVIILNYYRDLKHGEIASILHTTRNNVYQLHKRAKDELYRILKKL